MADAKRIGFEDVEFGDELPETVADISLATVRVFTDAAGMSFSRFNDHEEARKSGLPGAIVPGIMSQGIFSLALEYRMNVIIGQYTRNRLNLSRLRRKKTAATTPTNTARYS